MSEYNTYMNMAPANPAVAAVKKTGGSALFLIATITYTVTVLLSLISAFMPSSMYAYADMLYELTYDYSVYETISAMNAGSIFGAVYGIDAIDPKWYRPFNGKMDSYFNGVEPFEFTDFVDRVTKQAEKMLENLG